MKILFTAFKGIHNSSRQLISELNIDKLYLTNSFDGIYRDIENFDFSSYNTVIMFGLNSKLKYDIRIESYAKIEMDIQKTVFNVYTLSKQFYLFHINNSIAKTNTEYLCNYAYFLMLKKMKGRAIFIHIPPEKYLSLELKQNIIKAFETIFDDIF
jgi:hypothetical protein